MSESRFYHITREGKLVLVATLAEALAATKIGGFVWLDYSQPTKEELSFLIDPFGLHPLSIEDCVDENQIPKIDDYPRYTFIVFNAFNYSQGVLSIDEVDMFIGADFLITVNSRGSENRQLLRSIERIAELDPESVRQGPAFLLHVILDHIVDQKFVAIEAFEDELDKAEEAILSDLTEFQSRYSAQPASESVCSPQEPFPRAGDPREDLPQGLPFHPGESALTLSRHLRSSRQILRIDRDLARHRHQPHGDVSCPC